MKKNMTSTQEIKFRGKFLKQIGDGKEKEIQAFQKACLVFLDLYAGDALKSLWAMSFKESQENSLNALGLTASKVASSNTLVYIPQELVIPLRNELRYQYKAVHENFLRLDCPDEYVKAYNDFTKVIGMDEILSASILIRCICFITLNQNNTSWISKTIYLLGSTGKENLLYGGLKNICLKTYEAKTLFDKAPCISKFLENLWDISRETPLPSPNSLFKKDEENVSKETLPKLNWNTPFAGLAEMLKANGVVLPDEEMAGMNLHPEGEAPDDQPIVEQPVTEQTSEKQPDVVHPVEQTTSEEKTPTDEIPVLQPVEQTVEKQDVAVSSGTSFTKLTSAVVLANKEAFSVVGKIVTGSQTSIDDFKPLLDMGFDMNVIIGKAYQISNLLVWESLANEAMKKIDEAIKSIDG